MKIGINLLCGTEASASEPETACRFSSRAYSKINTRSRLESEAETENATIAYRYLEVEFIIDAISPTSSNYRYFHRLDRFKQQQAAADITFDHADIAFGHLENFNMRGGRCNWIL